MTPDIMLLVVTSLAFATVFLALLIGMTDGEPKDLVSAVANMGPGARKKARIDRLDDMTRLADEAIEARKLGKRINASEVY